jgi:DNA-damage-inducible protein D
MNGDEQKDAGGNPASNKVDMGAAELFHFNEGCPNFEDIGQENGFRYWWASDFCRCLGYEDYNSFQKAINRAIGACSTLGIPNEENFVSVTRDINGKPVKDHKLSRFACYLTAMNGDVNKPRVAQAQTYFAVMAESFRQYLADAEAIERVNIRDEVSGREKSLGHTAKAAGVTEYALFQNAGYRGMYNMNLTSLKVYKKMPASGKSLLDYMGKAELAANLFRITQTEAKIVNESISGQKSCERAAEKVGKTVRETMIKISGQSPEALPLKEDIQSARKNLKQAHKGFKKLDQNRPKKLPPANG